MEKALERIRNRSSVVRGAFAVKIDAAGTATSAGMRDFHRAVRAMRLGARTAIAWLSCSVRRPNRHLADAYGSSGALQFNPWTDAIAISPSNPSRIERARKLRRSHLPRYKEISMNWDRIEGNWKQFKGKAKEQWGKLTDDQLDVIGGHRDQLVGKVQESYGIGKDEAEKQVSAFADRYNDELPDDPALTRKMPDDRTARPKL
jgi:uncharacterized protein YjbJ (UPF0337 family)